MKEALEFLAEEVPTDGGHIGDAYVETECEDDVPEVHLEVEEGDDV